MWSSDTEESARVIGEHVPVLSIDQRIVGQRGTDKGIDVIGRGSSEAGYMMGRRLTIRRPKFVPLQPSRCPPGHP